MSDGKGTDKAPFFPHGSTIVDASLRRQQSEHGIGARGRKIDGAEKALGRTRFADDYSFPGMLHCKLKRSTRPHARIVRIDVAAALALPGVHAIITGADLPTRYGIIPWTQDETALAVDKVRYVGDAIAAVAAIDEETANAAVRAIKVEYQDLVPVLDLDTAKRTGDTPESKVNELAKKGNVTKNVALSFGPVDDNIAACRTEGAVVEDTFFYVGTTHAPIEPHCAIGLVEGAPGGAGLVTVISATQVPHYLHRDLAHVLGIPEARVRVIQPPVGGAFGGKSEPFTLEFAVAKLAMITGRPVKCLYTREEVFLAHRGRHPMRMRFTTAADKQGKLKAVKSVIDLDGGAYASFGMITAYYAGQILTGPVAMESYAFDATRYYTNKPACGPKRGHGSVQPRFAFECHLDMLAEKLGLDPIELRRLNFAGEHVTLVNGQRLGSSGLLQCLDAVERASGWRERRGKLGALPAGRGTKRRGLGVASSMYISGTNYPIYPNEMPQSGVQVKLDRSGRVTLFSGASDIGQGSDTVLMTIACEELGVLPEHVRVVSSDTDLTPVDLGAYSSRVTLMMGHAALEACRRLREQVQEAVAHAWGCARDDVLLGLGKAWARENTEKSISTAEAFKLAEARFGTLGSTGGYRTHPRGGDYRGGTIGASPAYSSTAHIAEVEVDTETGVIDIVKVWVAHDCGTAIAPVLVEGQIEGSTSMGAAEVFLENMLYGADAVGVPAASAARRGGMLVGPSLLDYRIPTSLDGPAVEAHIVERPDGNGPYGAKEAGEGPLHSTIPAVVNAVYDAVGVRFFELPLSPARVLAGLRAKNVATPTAAE
ncbi:MAG: molybdopterin-dependent oxidoreductase [Deltaproteobacteria bacterium]|nr:molybdopterin-dependent oxidoreductase [Deltaproteobacteria bacterium]